MYFASSDITKLPKIGERYIVENDITGEMENLIAVRIDMHPELSSLINSPTGAALVYFASEEQKDNKYVEGNTSYYSLKLYL
jgi:hypothetical protein